MISFRSCSAFQGAEAAFDVVAVAASAGGIGAVGDLLAGLPSDFPAAVLVQLHLHSGPTDQLQKIFQKRSGLSVQWVEKSERLRPGVVSLASPGKHVRVDKDGRLAVSSVEEHSRARPTADGVFESVAYSYTSRAIGVVLTGHLNDGARGVRLIKQMGGRVLAQNPDTARARSMPCAAIATGCVDLVLPLHSICAALIMLVREPADSRFMQSSDQRSRDWLQGLVAPHAVFPAQFDWASSVLS